jgi:predicted YcjX-like family ATPase
VRLNDLTDTAADALKNAGSFVSGLATPTLRLGVTGLAGAGKTVFITALVRNLIAGGRLPFFAAMAEGRISRAWLEPQPDDTLPRFAYEEHLGELAAPTPEWPASTGRLSQLRLAIEFEPGSRLRRALSTGRLNLDIIDYPGEWLLDLPLLQTSFAAWSLKSVAAAAPETEQAADAFTDFLTGLDPDGPAEEASALTGASLFTQRLKAARERAGPLAATTPGRFLLPGDLAGSPLLTFFPLPPRGTGYLRGTLGAMLERRFESYKARIVRPFFREHFANLDRQIVLVDALAALNGGREALRELEDTLTAVLGCFRPGANSWASRILAPRVDRLLFAATKADHLHHTSHDRLEAVLRRIADKAIARAAFAGAEVKVMALAALRATREAQARSGRQLLPVIVGVPLAGERLGRRVFDGKAEAAVFPGDLPADPGVLFEAGGAGLRFVRFRPPRLAADAADWFTHIRLDRALDFLLGDRLL